MDKWTDGQMDKWTDGQMDRWTDGQMDRWIPIQNRSQTDIKTDRQPNGFMNGW